MMITALLCSVSLMMFCSAAARSQAASLLALQAVTSLLAQNADLSTLLSHTFDPDDTTSLSAEQAAWLRANSLAL